MGKMLFIVVGILTSGLACGELYAWTDSSGSLDDRRNSPASAATAPFMQDQTKNAALDAEKIAEESAKQLLRDTNNKIAQLLQQVDDAVRSVDEYNGKNRSVSASDFSSLLNSLSYEIYTLKQLSSESSLSKEAKSQVKRHVAELDKKYNDYNAVINDFDSIVIGTITVDGLATERAVTVATNARNRNDAPNQNIYITDPDLTIKFLVPVTNNGSKAEVILELSGLNGRGIPVTTHTMRTTVPGGSTRDVVDHTVLQGVLAMEIVRWEVSDVKIVRNRR